MTYRLPPTDSPQPWHRTVNGLAWPAVAVVVAGLLIALAVFILAMNSLGPA
jgi:maltodextrin utilization protein YvdJ